MTVSRETESLHVLTQHLLVSRETLLRLQSYADLLLKWQARLNLIGPATIPNLWTRHFLDSAQLLPYLPTGPFLDMGSGAGFPGLVLAILRGTTDPGHLVESDSRKCAFLREVARVTEAPVTIHNVRIESLVLPPISAITARALAPLEQLLTWAEPFLTPTTECFFLKGRNAEDELTQAAKNWKMRVDRIASVTDPQAIIFHLREVYRG